MQFGQVYCNAFVLALCSCLLIICIACRMIGNNQNNNLNEFNNHINNNKLLFMLRTDSNQCLTISKIVATILVCVGIILFTLGKQKVSSVLLDGEEKN